MKKLIAIYNYFLNKYATDTSNNQNIEEFDNIDITTDKKDFSSKESIIRWLEENNIKNYTINDDLTVDVDNSIYLPSIYLPSIYLPFIDIVKQAYYSLLFPQLALIVDFH